MRFKKGFTIIEVLVVIGIIAVLTAIIFPAINEIRAKNRDAERVADIAAIQLGLLHYYSQIDNSSYPDNLQVLVSSGYVTEDTITAPPGQPYTYVPLTRAASPDSPGAKCTYYHLGAILELPSAQIDTADQFNSTIEGSPAMNGYSYCRNDGPGIATSSLNYNVHP